MNKKKILIVSKSFYPTISPRSFRATELAKEFTRQGHDVDVFTHLTDFNLNEFFEQHNINIMDFTRGKWKDLSKSHNFVIRVLRKILKYLILYPEIKYTFLVSQALKEIRDYDLLISLAFPYSIHWGVALAIRKNKQLAKVWVADCGDPFIGNTVIINRYPFYFRFVENWFCKQPDFITIPIKEAIDEYPKSCKGRIRVIPQGFSFVEVSNPPEKMKNPFPIFAYSGLLRKDIRDPGKFLEYLCTKSHQKFKFIIFTKNLSLVKPYTKRLGDKLEIRDYLPREQLLKELSKMDFLVNFEYEANVQSPIKLIDYALVKRPVLSVRLNNLNEKIITEFLNGDYSNQLVIKDIEQYNIINVTNQFLKLIE